MSTILFPLIYMLTGLYPGSGFGAVETIRRLCHSTTLAFSLMLAAPFVYRVADALYRDGDSTVFSATYTAEDTVSMLRRCSVKLTTVIVRTG